MSSLTWLLTKLIKHGFDIGRSRQISDVRGRRFVAVIQCILNQNARDNGAARFPAMNFELVQLCQQHGVGMLQMPCPEIAALGPKRTRKPGQSLREALDTEHGRKCCANIACDVADRIEDYLAQECRLLAVLGGNCRSPGCAIRNGETGLLADSGIFMKELQATLRARGLEAPFRGMRDNEPELLGQDLEWLRELLMRRCQLPD